MSMYVSAVHILAHADTHLPADRAVLPSLQRAPMFLQMAAPQLGKGRAKWVMSADMCRV